MTVPVTVAVVSWNTRELLDRCLRSLRPEAEAGRAQVWVVDNASEDGSAELVRREHSWVELVQSERNLGFGPAVNLVAGQTGGEWIAAANADVELRPGALTSLLDAGARDPGAGAIAPRLVLPDGTVQHSVHAFPTVASAAMLNLGLHRVVPGLGDRLSVPGSWDPARSRRVDWAIAAFLLVRRAAWEAVDGFDPAQWMYAEDLDLGWRLRQAGWATRYEPAAHVGHASGAATWQVWREHSTEQGLRSTYAWLLRRRGAVRTRAYAAVNVAGATGRWAVWTPPAWFGSQRFGDLRDEARWWASRHRRTGFASRADLERHR